MSEPKRIFRKNEQTPEERAVRERFSLDRPSHEELIASGEYEGPFSHGTPARSGSS